MPLQSTMIEAAFLGTFIPLLFLLAVLRHSRPLLSVFCWGMVAFMLARHEGLYLAHLFDLSRPGHEWLRRVVLTPALEEVLKSLPLLYFLFSAKRSFRPFIYIFGMAAGIGFAVEENLLYLFECRGSIADNRMLMILRSISTCVMHGSTTALIGFSFSTLARRGWTWLWLAALAYLGAIAFHSAFNHFLGTSLAMAAMIMPIAFFAVGAVIAKVLSENAPEAQDTSWMH